MNAIERVGGFGQPSKMPGLSYGIPARACITGGKLRTVAGSVCSVCYARRGNYPFPTVQRSLERRLAAMALPGWVDDMVVAIQAMDACGFVRWFDSGDIQSVAMLRNIVAVCRRLPQVRFWLPTHEPKIVAAFLKAAAFPGNLVVRISAVMVNGPASAGRWTSRVSNDPAQITCPSHEQGNQCLRCRVCWDPAVENVTYRKS